MNVYADNAATTCMSPTAIKTMLHYMEEVYGNPSSLHSIGQQAKEALDDARARVAARLGCEPSEIIFIYLHQHLFFYSQTLRWLSSETHIPDPEHIHERYRHYPFHQ